MSTYLKKNARKRKRKQQLLLCLTASLLAVMLFCIIGNHSRSSQVQASDAYATVTCYASVYVQAGDTLWEIADEYMDSSYSSKAAYIKEVKRLNHMTNDQLQAGSYIIVPYTMALTE